MNDGLYELEANLVDPAARGWLERRLRDAVRSKLGSLQVGRIDLIDGDERERFGSDEGGPAASVRVLDPRFYSSIALRGAIGSAEAYMDGHFEADDLVNAIRVIALNRKALDHLDGGAARLLRPLLRLGHRLRRNDLEGSRRNIAAHYDLGNDFFSLFLDPTLSYSSALFECDDATLEEASIAKLDRLCRKLALAPDDHLLEIGTGWGGLAIHAARRYGCRVTTTTISREQFELARERVRAAGLADRVEVLFEDYRLLRGRFDKLVSVEMIEAVGAEHWDAYLRVCSERLRDDGLFALQAISVRDQDLASSLESVDFIKKYIFPGGQLVSVGALTASMTRASDLRIAHYEDITDHYAKTLRHWRARFEANLPAIAALGLDERFVRMWRFYLCYCEASFMERATHAFQMVFEKPMVRRAPLLGRLD